MAQPRVRPNLSSEKAARGLYALGDLVDVYDDDKHDGDVVRNPIAAPFVLIRVSGVTKAQVERYLDPETEDVLVGDRVERRVVRRRLFRVRLAGLPASVRQTLARDRYYETTLAALRTFIRNKATNQDEG